MFNRASTVSKTGCGSAWRWTEVSFRFSTFDPQLQLVCRIHCDFEFNTVQVMRVQHMRSHRASNWTMISLKTSLKSQSAPAEWRAWPRAARARRAQISFSLYLTNRTRLRLTSVTILATSPCAPGALVDASSAIFASMLFALSLQASKRRLSFNARLCVS